MRDFQTKTNVGGVPDSNTPEKYGGSEITSLRTEAKTAVSRTGQTLAPQDGTAEKTDQLAKALLINGVAGQSMIDGGSAGAYQLTPVTGANGLVIPDLYDHLAGATFEFVSANVNAGASTLDVGQTAGTLLGVKDLVLAGGVALSGGEMLGRVRVIFDLANDRFELIAIDAATLNGQPGSYYQQALTDVQDIELGASGSGNRAVLIDFHGDDTYADFGLRIVRNSTGPNASSEFSHRGTGNIDILAPEASATSLTYQGVTVWTAGNDGPGSGLDADTIDGAHYSTGTWAPELWDNSLSGSEGQTYAVQAGFWSRIGDRVTFELRIEMSSLGTLTGADPVNISLPFTSVNEANHLYAVTMGFNFNLSLTGNRFMATGQVSSNVAYLTLRSVDPDTGSGFNISVAEITASGQMVLSGSYQAA